MIESGKVTAGTDQLDIAGATIDNNSVHIAPGLVIADMVRKNVEKVGRRRLATTTGDLKTLLVKVYDVNGLTYPDSTTIMR